MYSKKRSYSKISGRGLYKNTLAGGSTATIPTFTSQRDETGALHITHKEYICDLQGSATFQLQNYLVNPGNATLFPWLAQIAQNYDEYDFHGLLFHFRSTSTDNSTANAQLGTLIMAANYNANAPNFVNKQQMMEYDGAMSVKISSDLQYGIECDPTKNGMSAILFVAPNGATPAGEDPKTYQLCNLQIASNSSQNTGQIGELWCTYKVTLRKPKYCVTNALCQPFLESFNGPGAAFAKPTVTQAAATIITTGGVPFLNTTPVSSLSASQGSAITTNGTVTNITNGRAGPFNFSSGISGSAPSSYGVGFRFPDTLGTGTYLVQFIIKKMNVTTALTEANWSVLGSTNVQIYGIVKSCDTTPSQDETYVITFKVTILSSAFAQNTAAIDNTTSGLYVTIPNGTYVTISTSESFAGSSNTSNTATLIINQLNPSVTI